MSHITKICQVCGQEYQAVVNQSRPFERSKYCSRKCQTKAIGKLPEVQRTCPVCGSEFMTNHHDGRKTCSDQCANIHKTRNLSRTDIRVVINCEHCGKPLKRFPCRVDGRSHYCSRKCLYAHVAEQGTVTLICETCGKEFQIARYFSEASDSRKARYCSRKCKSEAFRITRRGSANPNWKGGTYPYYGPDWSRIVKKIRKRDNYTCQICGKRKKGSVAKAAMSVHHIVPLRQFNGDYETANHPNNLITLCDICHRKVEHGIIALQLKFHLLD